MEKARQEEAARVANTQIPPQPPPVRFQETPVATSPKFPTWGKVTAGVVATAIAIWLLYLALSPSNKQTAENQQPQTQASQSEPANQPPADQTQNIDAGKANPTPSGDTEAPKSAEKVESKPKNPPQIAKASTPSPTDTAAASVPPGLSAEVADEYRKAQSGSSDDMVWVGFAYEYGKGAPRDYKQSAYWYRKAAEAGNSYGINNVGDLYYYGRGGLPQNYQQALAWYRKSAEAANPKGMANLGWMYEKGFGVTKDNNQAVAWYRKAADAGDGEGMNSLGGMYENGQGVPQDKQLAISWYRKAAQLGDEDAKANLKRLGENP